jgi:hypothetical protein
VREGLVEGGDALAKGFYRGFTGLINKPLQGAKAGVGGEAQSCAGDRCLQLGRSVLSKAASEFFLLPLLAIIQARACARPGAHEGIAEAAGTVRASTICGDVLASIPHQAWCRCRCEGPAGSVPRLQQEYGQQTSTSDSYHATP